MWRTLFVSLIVLRSTSVLGGEVIVNHPVTRVVTSLKQLSSTCGIDGTYDACTQFFAYRLEASCSDDRMHATAAITPSIVLYNLRSLYHEHEHIQDMSDSLRRYVDALENRPFDSEVECRAAAADAMKSFESTVREFAAESLTLRDPTLKSYRSPSVSSRRPDGSSR